MDRLAFNSMASINEERIARHQLSNEIANVSTIGFKKTFDVTLQSHQAVGQGFDSRIQPRMYANDQVQLDPGPLMVTGRDLDVAMNHKTVLGVTGSNGELAFTRRGDLKVNASGVLETGTGHVVRSQDGGPITVPPGFKLSFGADGSLYAIDPTQQGVPQQQVIAQLMLRDASATPLSKREDGLFKVVGKEAGTDFATGPEPVSLTPQAVEGSSVNPMASMVKLIEQSRSFEHQVRIIKESKSNDESGASMMKAS
jgi:flagellar basal-body rod protein FlgF